MHYWKKMYKKMRQSIPFSYKTCPVCMEQGRAKHLLMYYRKRGSASYIVREVHSVRERERERERQRGMEVTSPLSR